MTAEQLLTIQELSERWQVPVPTIYGMNHKKSGPRYIKVGNAARYRLSDVIAWEDSRAAGGANTKTSGRVV